MCGRFVRSSPIESVLRTFNVEVTSAVLAESYNIAPTQEILIINAGGKRELVKCRWGLVPSWVRELSDGSGLINARAETLDEKPSFRELFRKGRCLIVADGFYEWKKEKGRKVPYYVRMKSRRPCGFAGLYNRWTSPGGESVCTCTIITTEANDLVVPVHDRMPVIVSDDKVDIWLDPGFQDTGALKEFLRAYPAEEMEMFRVSDKVNSPTIDDAANIMQADA
jgi:putative SOS response-associated peptidase YedK